MEKLSHRLDLRLDRIQTLLEEGNQHAKDSRAEMQEELGHLNDKVDRVQDTVAYIKKNLSTLTPYRLAGLLLCMFLLWVVTIQYFLSKSLVL